MTTSKLQHITPDSGATGEANQHGEVIHGRPADHVPESQPENDPDDSPVLDRAAIDRDITAGAKAFNELQRHADADWTRWSTVILGLRGLRSLAFVRARTNNMQTGRYREAMSGLLAQQKYAIYDLLDKQTRSDCYKLMDRLDDVDAWYAGLPTACPPGISCRGNAAA